MGVSNSKIIQSFNSEKIFAKQDHKSGNPAFFAIMNFFHKVFTLGLTRSLYETREENKKEFFNLAFPS